MLLGQVRNDPNGYLSTPSPNTGDAVRVWDTVGEDQSLKGEYKAISGRMYAWTPLPPSEISDDHSFNITETILPGTAKVKESSPLEMEKRSLHPSSCSTWCNSTHVPSDRFGHAFMMDSGTSTGEITAHAKVYGIPFTTYHKGSQEIVQPINAVSIRHQRPFRAATAGDDGLIVFHQGTVKTKRMGGQTSESSFFPSGVPFKYDKVNESIG